MVTLVSLGKRRVGKVSLGKVTVDPCHWEQALSVPDIPSFIPSRSGVQVVCLSLDGLDTAGKYFRSGKDPGLFSTLWYTQNSRLSTSCQKVVIIDHFWVVRVVTVTVPFLQP